MTTAIDRLRKSHLIAQQDDYSAGKKAGTSWASKSAKYEELARISRFCATVENCRSAKQPSSQAIDVWDKRTLATVKKNSCSSDAERVTAFIGGFLEGASKFFDQIKGRVMFALKH